MSQPTSPTRGTLFVISLPIGNPEDITLRALRILRSADAILVEDTRVSKRLLASYGASAPLLSLAQRALPETQQNLRQRLQSGECVALICDAGTPCIADPGASPIQIALEEEASVTAVPGASATLAALAISGFAGSRFAFEGFPPRNKSARKRFFANLLTTPHTHILFESTPFLLSTLRELQATFGASHPIAIAQNLTHPQERVFRGSLTEALLYCSPIPKTGQYALVIPPLTIS